MIRLPPPRTWLKAAPKLLEQPYIYLWLAWLACILVMRTWYWPAAHGLDVAHHQIGRDFINNWAGPRIAFGGHLATLFDLDGYVDAISEQFGQTLPFHNWGYPPFTLIAFWPLAQLPYFVALAVWTVGLFAIFARVGISFGDKGLRPVMFWSLLCSPACIVNAIGGQNGFLSASLFLGGILLLDKRPWLAGVLFGLLTFKPQLGLVLPLALIALFAWRTVLAACLTTAALVGLSILVLGVEPWRHYLVDTSAFQLGLLQNLHGFYPSMMTSVLVEARIWGGSFNLGAVLQAVVALPVLLLAGWSMRWTTDPRRRAFILAAACPLITPYAFNYDLTALTVVILWRLIEDPPRIGSAKDNWLRATWFMPILVMPLNMAEIGIVPIFLLGTFAIAIAEVAPKRFSAPWRPAAATA